MQARRLELFIIIAIIGALGIVYALTQSATAPVTSNTNQSEDTKQAASDSVSYQGVDGKNALELLRASYDVKTQTFSGAGEFVTEINGIKPDATQFWSYYVNRQQAQVGADQYMTKSTDKIEWRLEKIN